MKRPLISLSAIFATVMTACESDQAGFSGSVGRTQARIDQAADTGLRVEPKDGDRVIDAPCSAEQDEKVIEVTHNGSTQDSFQVKAEWCLKGKQVGRLKLMFLVDLSGSMKDNDPMVGGSCGRLDGARALVERIQSVKRDTDVVEVAAVTFGSEARPASDFIPLDDFVKTKMNADIFCDAVDQTNYSGALEVAADLIQTSGDTETPVVAYLLSDGLPSLGTERSQEDFVNTERSAIDSARVLLGLGNVSLNAVYLQSASVAGTTSPEAYLGDLTGSPDKVKIVSNAEDLGASITTFELPAAKASAAAASATLTGAGDACRIPVKSVKDDPNDRNKVVVTTKRFKLSEDGDDPTSRYTIKLKVDAADGSVRQKTIVINLKP